MFYNMSNIKFISFNKNHTHKLEKNLDTSNYDCSLRSNSCGKSPKIGVIKDSQKPDFRRNRLFPKPTCDVMADCRNHMVM